MSRRNNLVGALGLLLLAAPLAAQPQASDESVDPALEGRRGAKTEYLESRRRNPEDPLFDAARARLSAIQIRRLQQALQGPDSLGSVYAWANIGPSPTTDGQTPTSTPRFPSDVSGRVSAIAISSIGTVFVGGAQGGVWRSTDNGASWTALMDFEGSTAVGSIAIDPNDDTTIYVGTGEGNGSCDSYAGIGVFKSTDSGDNWTGPFGNTQFNNRSVNSIVVDRTNSDHLLATSASGIFGTSCTLGLSLPQRGIFESEDGGATWTKKTTGDKRGSRVLQDPVVSTTWWTAMWEVGSDVGLFKSIDDGETWTEQAGANGLPALAGWGRAWITGTPGVVGPDGEPTEGADSVLFLGNGLTNGAPGQGAVYRSLNSGGTWTELTNARGYCNAQCFYDMPILVEPGDPDVLYVGGAGASTSGSLPSQFMRSSNATAATPTFTDLVRSTDSTTAVHADMHAFATVPGSPAKLWLGNDGGVWRSDDRGTNLVDVNNNLALTQFSGCDLHPTEHKGYGGTQDNGTMGWDGTTSWPHLDFGDGGFARIDQGEPNNLVHTYFNAQSFLIGVGYTMDGFNTTQGFYCGSFASGNGISISDRVLFYAPIHLDRGNTDTLYFGTHRLYRATDFFPGPPGPGCPAAANFSPLGGGAGQDLAPGGGAVSAIETFKNGASNATLLFTGSNNGRVFRSTDGGATAFTEVDLTSPATFVSDILVDPNDSSLVLQSRAGFAGVAGQNVRRSLDGGTTWAASGAGIPDIPVNALAFDSDQTDRIWAGTDIGMYVSTDQGATWQIANSGMPDSAIFDMASNPATGDLIACTHGRSAWRQDTCPSDIELKSVTINGTQLREAENTIAVEGTLIGANADVTFLAGTRTTIGNGFSVADGALLTVTIDPACIP